MSAYWALFNTLSLPIGIWLLRNGPAYYHSIRASFTSRKDLIRPAPSGVSHALNLLYMSVVVALLYTLPYFTPSNVFKETRSGIQTSTDVIFSRLGVLRALSPLDLALKSKLTSKNARLIYLAYGPDAVANCNFCSSSNSTLYFYYTLPILLAPHLLHLAVVGLATSPILSGHEGARWRTYVFWASLIMISADVYWHLSYDMNANSATTGIADMDPFYWTMRYVRGLSFVGMDLLLAAVMWLASTNRAFLSPPSTADRLQGINNTLNAANFRLWATGNIRNTVVRDQENLSPEVTSYWLKEKDIYETREVVDAMASATSRADMQALSRAADQSTTAILSALGSQAVAAV